ncbi:UBA domain-containing protein [Heracleum sosnowskyi]|uniref:UBA domain-containing protein n=1 Tax=Heracleum sosnowskyi TaxID=360622 RepID=A0AAD8GN25_9APIA|nr:UBA domain-containing protein [Heracleum sosnowskyi]
MAVPEVNMKLLQELQAMGFPVNRATRALHYSGNSSLEDAINWVIDHETDPDIDEMPLIPVNIEVQASEPPSMTEQLKLKAQELRDRAQRTGIGEKKSGRENERIKRSKELLEAKQIAEENERKRFIASREEEKAEEKRAREKIRQKLQQDKLERRSKLQLPPDDLTFVYPAMPMIQKEKDPLPGAAKLPMKFSTKAELMSECLRSLRRKNKHDEAGVKKSFQTLLYYVRNVTKDPDEERFRRIRLSNPNFVDRVGCFKEGIDFLELCGFERIEGDKFLCLHRDKFEVETFRSAEAQLESAITSPFFGLISS